MIRIRPGRSWRHNPGYLGALRQLTPPRALSYGFGDILDVVGLEVDGVDIAEGVGEAPVLHTMGELLQALLHLAQGAGAAQATVGPGPTEVVLEPRGPDVLLTLCTLRKPSRVLAAGLLVDAARLRAAVLQAARGLLRDVLDVSPALANARLIKSLLRSCERLGRKPRRQPADWPSARAAASTGFVARGSRGKVACEVHVPPEAAARLAAAAEVPHARLAPLLGRGTLALRLPGAPALSLEGPPWLVLRELVREAAALVHAWEAGEPSFALSLGATELVCDLPGGSARAPGFSTPARAHAVQVAAALAGAARSFADKAQRLGLQGGARAPEKAPLDDLRAAAEALLRQCRDLSTGDLRRAAPAAPPPPSAAAPHVPLGSGRLRKLVLREAFREQLPAMPDALFFHGGAFLVARTGPSLEVRDAASGRLALREEIWPLPAGGRCALAAGGDLVLELRGKGASGTLARIDPGSAAARFQRRTRGAPASLHPAGAGILRAAADGGWSLVGPDGSATLRGSLPAPPLAVFRVEGVLLFLLPSGLVLGKGAQDGEALFRRRVAGRIDAVAEAGGRVLCAVRDGAERSLIALDPATGAEVWRSPLPAQARPASLSISGETAALICGEAVVGMRLRDGAQRFAAKLAWPGEASFLQPLDDLEGKEELPAAGRKPARASPGFLATGPDGAARRLDERGAQVWSLAEAAPQPAAPALVARGVALLSRDGLSLVDALEGLPLARVTAEPPLCAALSSDLSVAAVFAGNALAVQRLATHLSVV